MFSSKSSRNARHIAEEADQLMEDAGENARDMAHRVVESMRDTSHKIHDRATHTSASLTRYVQREPVKSVLIAAAMGAAVMALVDLALRSRQRD